MSLWFKGFLYIFCNFNIFRLASRSEFHCICMCDNKTKQLNWIRGVFSKHNFDVLSFYFMLKQLYENGPVLQAACPGHLHLPCFVPSLAHSPDFDWYTTNLSVRCSFVAYTVFAQSVQMTRVKTGRPQWKSHSIVCLV